MSRRAPGPAAARPALSTPSCGVSSGGCEIGDALRLVAKAHVLDALDLVASDVAPLRFNALQRALRVNANVLSLRLRDLVEAGLVERRETEGAQPAVDYEATAMGRDLLAALGPLRAWARLHAPPPVALATARVRA